MKREWERECAKTAVLNSYFSPAVIAKQFFISDRKCKKGQKVKVSLCMRLTRFLTFKVFFIVLTRVRAWKTDRHRPSKEANLYPRVLKKSIHRILQMSTDTWSETWISQSLNIGRKALKSIFLGFGRVTQSIIEVESICQRRNPENTRIICQ